MQRKAAFIVAGLLGVLCLWFLFGTMGYNDDENWQIRQTVGGNIKVRDNGGYYLNWFAHVTDYPRYMQAWYSAHHKEGGKEDDSIRCTFNDGGTAQTSVYVKFQTPIEETQRREFHRITSANPENAQAAVRAHLVNCVKAAGPLMSASENQASRKAEFAQVIQDMLSEGLFVMRRTKVELTDQATIEVASGDSGEGTPPVLKEKPTTVMATEIVLDEDGTPKIAEISPLKSMGISILQFSVTHIEYDPETQAQFAAKKQSFLLAEQAKAQRQQFVQERLKIISEGEAEVAKIEMEGNQAKMKATVEATQEAEVAVIKKQQAVTEAEQKVEVAEQMKLEQDTMLEIAKVEAETAEEKKKALIADAEAQAKALEIGGALSEEEQVLAEIKAKRDVEVAKALASLNVPGVVIVGGSETAADGSQSGGLTENLINLTLLKSLGILEDGTSIPASAP